MNPRSLSLAVCPKVRRSTRRRAFFNRRAAAFSLALASMLSAALPFAQAANTAVSVVAGATDLSLPASYSGTALPTATNDVQFVGPYTSAAPITFTVNGAALTYGTLDDVDTTQAITVTDTNATPGTITLSTAANGISGTATDLLFVKSGANLTFTSGTGLTLATAVSGNVNNAGTLAIGSALSIGAGTTLSFTAGGTTTISGNIANTTGGLTNTGGTLVLSGANAYTGATTISGGTLNLNSTGALGGGTNNFGQVVGTSALNLSGGTLNNTSGAALTLAFNAPITLGANFSFGTATSTSANNLNLGTGAVTFAAGRTVTFAGVGTTLTMGGVASYTTATTAVPTAGNSNVTLTVSGAGNTLVLGGLALDTNTASTVGTVFGEAGTGILVINGPVTNGNAFANGIVTNTFTATNTLTLLGTNSYTGLTNILSGVLNLGGDNTGATGGLVVSNATLNLLSNTALGTGTFNVGPASINNTGTTGALTETNNPAITISNNVGFNIANTSTATSANNVNLGNGAVSLATGREFMLGGTGTTLTFGGALTNTSTSSQTLTVFGAGNTLSLGSLVLSGASATGSVIFGVAGNGNLSIPGAISNGGTGANQFFINGTGTYTLGGTNTFTGPEQISGGTLNLDYSTNNTSKLSASTLVFGGNLGGGTVNLSGGSFQQTAGNTNLNYGPATITRTSGTATLSLGAITRATGATINFDAAGFVRTTTGNTNGIIGSYATVGGTTNSADWATNVGTGGTAPTAYTGYSAFVTSNVTPNTNGDALNPLLTGSSALTGNVITNSLKINSATGSAQSLTIPAGNALALTSGGLLYTGSDAYSINGGTLRNPTTGSSDLVVQQFGGGTLTINSVIGDAAYGSGTFGSSNALSFTKAGPGTLVLGGANTYTGTTYVNAGTLQINTANTLLPTSGLVVNGILNLNGASQSVDTFNGTGTVVNNGAAATTFSVGNGNGIGTYLGSVNDGTGTLSFVKNGTGTINLQGVNSYSGATLVNAGTLQINGQNGSIANSTNVTVTGATLNVGDLNGPAGRLNPATALTVGGTNGGANFNTGRLASGAQNLSIATFNLGAGTSGLNNQVIGGTTADSGFLLVTGPGTSNYNRNAGGFLAVNGGGGDLNLSFSNPVTNGSASGVLGTTAILVGVVINGGNSNFFSASGNAGNAITTTSLQGGTTTGTAGVISVAGSNTILTNTATAVSTVFDAVNAATTINSLQFATAGIAASTTTLTLNSNLTVSSGGILAGNMSINSSPTINGTGSLSTGGTRDLWMYVNNPLAISAPITDNNANAATNDLTGGISKGGIGVLTLSGANTFAGPIYLTGGVLGITNPSGAGTASALGLTTSTAPIIFDGNGSTSGTSAATLRAVTTGFTTTRNMVLAGGSNTAVIDPNGLAVVLNGVISSQGSQSTNLGVGAGQLAITSSVAAGTVTLGGANTFTGPTAITSANGTLILANQLALQNSQFNGGTGALQFDASVTGNAFTFGALGANTTINLVNNAATPVPITLSIGNNNLNATSNAVLAGAGSVVKIGTGTQTFTAGNTFTGSLTINAGAINSTTSNFASIGNLNINTGGTMILSGANTTRISDTAPVRMGGGAFTLAQASREGTAASRTGLTTSSGTNAAGVGMLTLTANSSINFLGTSGTLVIGTGAAGTSAFDPTNGGTGAFTLTISGTNFGTGTLDTESSNDRLVFLQATAPTAAQLAAITFNQGGTLFGATSAEIGTTTYYDIIPGAMAAVPEPSTWVAGLLCLGTLGFSQRRRIGSVLRKHAA